MALYSGSTMGTTTASGIYGSRAYYGYSPTNFGSIPSPSFTGKEKVTDKQIYYLLT